MQVSKPSTILRALTVAGLLLLLLTSVQRTYGAQPESLSGLFSSATVPANVPLLQEPTVARMRFVNVRFDLLGNRAQGPGKTLRLNLFDDTMLQAHFERWDQVGAFDSIWIGKIDGVPLSNVTLVAKDGLMQGQISMPNGIYQIRYVVNGVHAIQQINQHALPPEAPPLRPNLSKPTIKSPASDFKIYLPFVSLGAGISLTRIDVLVAYTPAARAKQGDTSAMEAHIALAVSLTNTSYQNSGINQRLNLVRAMETNYTESGSMATDLYRVTGVAGYEGYMTDVRAARETYRADLVNLLTMPDPQYCGMAWLMTSVSTSFAPWGYSVVAAGSCATSNYSFAHELGHNMGARHDWYVDAALQPYTYAHGYVNLVGRWRTIMAYNSHCAASGFNCTRLPYWSNPDMTYNGAPLGVSQGTSTACQVNNLSNPPCDADNRKTLNNTAATVAAFR